MILSFLNFFLFCSMNNFCFLFRICLLNLKYLFNLLDCIYVTKKPKKQCCGSELKWPDSFSWNNCSRNLPVYKQVYFLIQEQESEDEDKEQWDDKQEQQQEEEEDDDDKEDEDDDDKEDEDDDDNEDEDYDDKEDDDDEQWEDDERVGVGICPGLEPELKISKMGGSGNPVQKLINFFQYCALFGKLK